MALSQEEVARLEQVRQRMATRVNRSDETDSVGRSGVLDASRGRGRVAGGEVRPSDLVGRTETPNARLFAGLRGDDERSLLLRTQALLVPLGIVVRQVRPMLTRPQTYTVDGVRWDALPLTPQTWTEPLDVPPATYRRIEEAEALGVHFDWYVLLRERPHLIRPVREATTDPILFGVIRTTPARGIWCELGRWRH